MIFLFLFFIICLSGCNSPTNVDARINEILDSLNINNDIASFHIKDMKDYWLYTISNDIGLIYDGEGNLLISEIRRMNGKDVIVYSTPKKIHNIDKEIVQQIEKSYRSPYHTIVWYFAITKDGKKEVLIQPANSDVMPYEIPEIRQFLNPSKKINDYEYIADYISISMDDSSNSISIYMHLNLYIHNQDAVESIPNDFRLALAKDTFRFNVDTLSLYRAYIDDTLWVADSTLKKRFSLHLEMSGNKTISKFKDKEVIKNILNESIFIRGKNDKIGLFIPSETQVHLQKNGNWLK
jgi:hypothetical protein